MAGWDPWRGCHRYGEGCKFCYIHKGDAKQGVDTNCITRTDKFDAPIVRKRNGEYRINSGLVYIRSLTAGLPVSFPDQADGAVYGFISGIKIGIQSQRELT